MISQFPIDQQLDIIQRDQVEETKNREHGWSFLHIQILPSKFLHLTILLPFQAILFLQTRNLAIVRLLRNEESVANEIIAHDDGTFAKLPPTRVATRHELGAGPFDA